MSDSPPRDRATRAAILAVIAAAMAMAVHPVFTDDFWMHLAAGRWIFQNGEVPRTDPFSWTTSPRTLWIGFEWLFQVVVYAAYRLVGLNGLILCFAALAGATVAVLARACRRSIAPGAIAPTLLAAVVLASDRWLNFRADFFSLLFSALTLLALEEARAGRRRWLWMLPPLVWVWAQMHGGFMLAFFLLGAYAAGGALQRWLGPNPERAALAGNAAEWRQVALVAALSVAAIFVNPYGWRLAAHVGEQMQPSVSRGFIVEWLPTYTVGALTLTMALYWLTLAAGALGLALNWRRTDWARALAWAGLAVLSWRSRRFVPYFGLLGVPLTVAICSAGWSPRKTSLRGEKVFHVWPSLVTLFASAALVATAWVGGRDWIGQVNLPLGLGTHPLANPVTAVEFLGGQPAPARLFNSNELGNYLMWALPERKVFIDPRNLLYGNARSLEYVAAFASPRGWEQMQTRWNFDAVLLQSWDLNQAALMSHLARDPRWKLVYFDPAACLFVRRELAASWQTGGLSELTDLAKVAAFRDRWQAQMIEPHWTLAPLPRSLATARQRRISSPFLLPQALYNLGALDAAAQEYRHLLDAEPDSMDAMHGLALIAADRRDWPTALDWLARESRARPNLAQARLLRAYIFAQTNRAADALAEMEAATRQQPHNFKANLEESRLAEQLGDLEHAIRSLRRAIRDLPVPSPLHYTRLGSLFERQNKISDAIAAYEKAVAFWPTDPSLPPADAATVRSHAQQLRDRRGN